MNNDLIYQIALTLVPNIGDIHAKSLMQIFGTAKDIFGAPKRHLESVEGIGSIRAAAIKKFSDYSVCEKEISFLEKYTINPLFITSESYPKKLYHCCDAPAMIYFKGKVNLNDYKIISVVGTRNNTDYGKYFCEKLIEDLKAYNIIIVSGLAFGIDTIAHKTAVKNNIPTLAVLAHGLDRIYPSQNKTLAKQMIENGGLLTEFRSGTKPDKQNFPRRNRITAGICDALVVIESGEKGGSLITAELANSYNRDVFALPGRITDIKSEGCNALIKNNKASIINDPVDLLEIMNWKKESTTTVLRQRNLFENYTHDEKIIVDLLMSQGTMHIDDLVIKSGLSNGSIAGVLLKLEMSSWVIAHPGKRYSLA